MIDGDNDIGNGSPCQKVLKVRLADNEEKLANSRCNDSSDVKDYNIIPTR